MNGMPVLSSRMHGFLDYIVSILLLITPDALGFTSIGGPAVAIPRVIGGLILMQTVLTRYESGLIEILPFSIHLGMEIVFGGFLLASPLLFGFYDEAAIVWLPHVLVGAFVLLSALTTETQPRFMASDQAISKAVSHEPSLS